MRGRARPLLIGGPLSHAITSTGCRGAAARRCRSVVPGLPARRRAARLLTSPAAPHLHRDAALLPHPPPGTACFARAGGIVKRAPSRLPPA